MSSKQNDLTRIWSFTGSYTDPGDTKYGTGWESEIPTYQNFNYVLRNADLNILALAEQNVLDWDIGVNYKEGAEARNPTTNAIYTARRDNVGQALPTKSDNNWTLGRYIGVDNSNLSATDGLMIEEAVDSSQSNWNSNDIKIKSNFPSIMFENSSTSYDNLVLNNRNGYLTVINVENDSSPTNETIATLTENRIYTTGYKPTQADVSGTIPDSPQDSKIYGRLNGGWVEATSLKYATTPPAVASGTGNLWWNMEDGRLYVDINDGTNNGWIDASPPLAVTTPVASTTQAGVTSYSTIAQVNTGTSSSTALTPSTFSQSKYGQAPIIEERLMNFDSAHSYVIEKWSDGLMSISGTVNQYETIEGRTDGAVITFINSFINPNIIVDVNITVDVDGTDVILTSFDQVDENGFRVNYNKLGVGVTAQDVKINYTVKGRWK